MARKRTSPPPIEIRDGQRRIRFSPSRLQAFASFAIKLAWNRRKLGSEILSADEILVLIIGDRRMASLHRRYLGVRGPTDVLTFQHGEIVMSVETARRQARLLKTSTEYELKLYLVHGLLHLCGFDDCTPTKRRRMRLAEKCVMRQTAEAGHSFERDPSRVTLADEPVRIGSRGANRRGHSGSRSPSRRKTRTDKTGNPDSLERDCAQ